MAILLFNLSNPPSISFLLSPPPQPTSRFSLKKLQSSAKSLPPLDSSSSLEFGPPSLPSPSSLRRQRLSSQTDLSSHADMGMFYSLFRDLGFEISEVDELSSVNRSLKHKSHDLIRARVLSLSSLGLTRFEIHELVSTNPDVLTSDEIGKCLNFLRNDLGAVKLRFSQLKTLLCSESISGFNGKVRVLLNNGVLDSDEQIGRVLNNVSLKKAFFDKSIEDIKKMVSFLKPFNFSSLIVKNPKILHLDLKAKLSPRLNLLLNLSGGDEEATAKLVSKHPAILRYTEDHIDRHIMFLKSSAGLTNDQVFKIFQVYPSIVSSSRDRRLGPSIEFLKECGLDSHDIFKFLTRAPLFVSLSFKDNIGVKLAFLVKLGFRYRTRELAVAMGSVCRTSCRHLQDVICAYTSFGLSLDDIVVMSNKHPPVLQYGVANVEEKIEYLVVEMGRDVKELVAFPTFLGYKLDGRIKHRHEVSERRGSGSKLSSLLSESSAKFSVKEKKKMGVELEKAIEMGS